MLADHQDFFKVVLELPEEIQNWINNRDQRLQPKERTPEEEAQLALLRQQNREKRLLQMQKGLDELEAWIRDAVRIGTSKLYGQAEKYWEEWASHLVNAKMGDLGKRFLKFPTLFRQDNWNEVLLEALAEMYFIIRAFRRVEYLPIGLQQDLLTTVGFYLKRKDLQESKTVEDTWLVVGQHEVRIDRLSSQKTWLFGQQTQQYALLLEYAFGSEPFPFEWQMHAVVKGELIFFPSNFPQRAFFKQFQLVTESFDWSGYNNFSDFQTAHTKSIASNPWILTFPALFEQVIPYLDESTDELWLIDVNFQKIPCSVKEEWAAWEILAVSGGHPIAVFGEWENQQFIPLLLKQEDRWIDFSIKLMPYRATFTRF